MSKIKFPDAMANEYRMIGVGCKVLSNFCISVGTNNIVGGYGFKIIGYDQETRKLTVAAGTEMGKFAVDYRLFIATHPDDDNSPHQVKIIAVDAANHTLTLASDLVMTAGEITPENPAIGAIQDPQREATTFASGDFNFNPGEYSTAEGTLNVLLGLGSSVKGVLNWLSGDMSSVDGNSNRVTGNNMAVNGINNRITADTGMISGFNNTVFGSDIYCCGAINNLNGIRITVLGNTITANANNVFAIGMQHTIGADNTVTIGYRLKNNAKSAVMIGRDAELENSPENEGAMGFGGGDATRKLFTMLSRCRRKIANPLYGQTGEPQFINRMGFRTDYHGHLLDCCDERTVNVAAGIQAVSLDHDWFGRWRITPTGSGQITFSADNWENGDRGTLVIVNGNGKVVWPSSWVWISANVPLVGTVGGMPDALQSSGYNIIIMFKFEGIIFCFPSIRNDGTIEG